MSKTIITKTVSDEELNASLAKLAASVDALQENVNGLAVENGFAPIGDGIVLEPCGCRYNWNDKFIETYCATHQVEMIEREDALINTLTRTAFLY